MTETRFEIDGKEYYITELSSSVLSDAQKVYNKAFREALEGGALLKKSLHKYMMEQGVWSEEKEKQYHDYVKRIADLEYKLNTGTVDGRKMKISEGRQMAIDLSQLRTDFKNLIAERNVMDSNTAEGQADNKRFNYLVAVSTMDFLTRKPVFSSVEDYVAKGNDPTTIKLASKFAAIFYGLAEDYEESLVETKFLRRFNMIDKEGRFIDKDGNFIDASGNRLDAEGYRIDENGNRLDINNHVVTTSTIETAEFEEG